MLNARLAQLVERKALNLVVVGSSPTVGAFVPVVNVLVACALSNKDSDSSSGRLSTSSSG